MNMTVKYYPELEKVDTALYENPVTVNRIEILDISLVVWAQPTLKGDKEYINVQFATPDLKVKVKDIEFVKEQVLDKRFLQTQEEFNQWVIKVAEKVILPQFKEYGKETLEKIIAKRTAEWSEVNGV